MMEKELNQVYKIRDLILKHLDESITSAERRQLEEWRKEKEGNERLFQEITDRSEIDAFSTKIRQIEERKAKVFQEILDRIELPAIRVFRGWRYVAAASVLFIGIITFFYINRNTGVDLKPTISSQADILPAGNKATLTLANGDVITLDNAGNGMLTRQGAINIVKLDSGQLAYEGNAGAVDKEILYNTIKTPRGGRYQVRLPDGSKVWLNAASSLRFSTNWGNNERRVELTGEAYFEVSSISNTKGRKQKFFVDIIPAAGMEKSRIEVLGTHFNIMAYADESNVQATLLEGAVKVSSGGGTMLLAPGEQAQVMQSGELKRAGKVNVEEVVAWKNGYFQFNNADLTAVMRQISRWYDVDISYEGDIPKKKFRGKISRNANASEILSILEFSNIHFRLEGRKIIITP